MKELKRNQCWEYLKKRGVKMGVRHGEVNKEDRRQKQKKMAKAPNSIGFGLKRRQANEGLVFASSHLLGFCPAQCFVFAGFYLFICCFNEAA